MKTKAILLVFFTTCLFHSSYGKGTLTKEEVQNAIDSFYYEEGLTVYIDKFVDKHHVPDNIAAIKKAGYIDLVSPPATGTLVFEVKVQEKGRPYIIREKPGILEFKVVSFKVHIISIAQPVIDKNGDSVCYVDYVEIPTRTPFFDTWGGHCFDRPYKAQGKFIKGKDGWKMESQEFE